MEIYKLTDEVPEKRMRQKKGVGGHAITGGSCDVDSFDESTFRITGLKQGAKRVNRVNVFVNEKFSFSLDEAQIVELGVKVGRTITNEELLELKEASEHGKLYQRALEWVLLRPRSVRETRDYLSRKSGQFDDIMERLIERGYLDDRKFAEWYVENRFVKKGVSRKRLAMELMKKGVAKDIIDDVLDARNDEEEIKKIIERKRSKYDDEKLMMYLCRQGFSYDLVIKVLENCG